MAVVASGVTSDGRYEAIRMDELGYIKAVIHNLLPCPDCASPRFVDKTGEFVPCAMCVVLAKLG